MSTMIKDSQGQWITVAGGHRTWVGTKSALNTALSNNQIPDGTSVMVTDDYDEWTTKYKAYTPTSSIPGITITLRDYNPKGMSATRVGDIIVIQYCFNVTGTFTGATGWFALFGGASDDTTFQDLIDTNTETIVDSSIPYFAGRVVSVEGGVVPDGVMQARYLYFSNNYTYNAYVDGQFIIPVSKK